jgi:pyruvate-ferredoxin/flavodoxin oxidoreductase
MNYAAVDAALAGMQEVKIPAHPDTEAKATIPPTYPGAPEFVQKVTARLLADQGDLMPVSALPVDGCWPTGTSRFEKRNIALETPVWDPAVCIQCNKCVLVCPHAAIRAKFVPPEALAEAPAGFVTTPFKANEFPGQRYTLQVAAEDCTGCSLCVQVCPAKDRTNPRHKAIDMAPLPPRLAAERANWDFFMRLPDPDRTRLDSSTVKGTQFMTPLIEFSGACAGCGETPYLKLLTQLFGDRLVIANATGCSSIYGGNLPTTPYCSNSDGRGPTWANSLFEDNAEFGLGLQLATEQRLRSARETLQRLEPNLRASGIMDPLLTADQSTDAGIAAQRARVSALREILRTVGGADARRLEILADDLVKKSVWIVGGDGWAYDIGYGGLDHVLASGANVKVLVLDTAVYSNTGGQASKSTPTGAVAKFAAGGKSMAKKDLAAIAMQYGHVYVAQVAFGAKDSQTVAAFREAEAYEGPALIIAYSHCIAHGFPLHLGAQQQKLAVESGFWPLFRFDPRLAQSGDPLKLDSGPPKGDLSRFTDNETRFSMLKNVAPAHAAELAASAQEQVKRRYALYKHMASHDGQNGSPAGVPPAAAPAAVSPAPPPPQT